MDQNKPPFNRNNLAAECKDTTLWPTVNISLLTNEKALLFKKRRKAIRTYLTGELVAKICEENEICRQELIRMVKRCVESHPDGRIWGWRAVIPYSRQKSVENMISESVTRKSLVQTKSTSKESAELSRLFYKFPQVQETVDLMFLKTPEEGIIHEPRIALKSIHKRFLEACRQAGIRAIDYPFTVKSRGRISLWKYLKKLFDRQYGKATRARFGEDAARRLRSQIGCDPDGSIDEAIVRPLQRVEFDAHLIDLFCTIILPSPYGGTIEKVLDRIWLLVIIDVLTRCVLGYHISFGKQYSAEDVLLCVKNALMPWQPKTLTIPGLKYPPHSGLPSGVFDDAKWALWDELAYDNAKANLADRVRKKLTSVVGCAINAGPIRTPERRPFIERFFGILEENGYHRLPSTTGNGPSDPRRDEPEKNALDLQISLQHIEELTDVMIAQYNGTPHSGLGFRTPLEQLEYFIKSEESILPRKLLKEQHNCLNLLNIEISRCVRGSRENGVGAHINFEGARYRNDVLSRSAEMIGRKLTLVVDPQDIRSIFAFLPNGAEFGVLTAQGKWGRTPHTLEMRQAILRLRNKKLIHYAEQDDPVQIYLDYLGQQSLKNRAARRQYARLQRRPGLINEHNSLSAESLGKAHKPESANRDKTQMQRKSDHTSANNSRNPLSKPKLKTFVY